MKKLNFRKRYRLYIEAIFLLLVMPLNNDSRSKKQLYAELRNAELRNFAINQR